MKELTKRNSSATLSGLLQPKQPATLLALAARFFINSLFPYTVIINARIEKENFCETKQLLVPRRCIRGYETKMSKSIQLEIISSRFEDMSMPDEICWSQSFTGSALIDFLISEALSAVENCSIAELRLILKRICSTLLTIGVLEPVSSNDSGFQVSNQYCLKHVTAAKELQRVLKENEESGNVKPAVTVTTTVLSPPPPPPPPMPCLPLATVQPPQHYQQQQQQPVLQSIARNEATVLFQSSQIKTESKFSDSMSVCSTSIPKAPPPLPCSHMSATNWNLKKPTLRKGAINPKLPMKPLYWNRILIPVAGDLSDGETNVSGIWTQIQEQNLENINEFVDLFSRQVSIRKPVSKSKIGEKPITSGKTTAKVQPAKILDAKRAQNVGILAKSLHIDFAEIENAIYNFDTSVVGLEAFQQIYEARATDEELQNIKKHVENKPEVPLDQSEQFLYNLSEIPNFAERISCLMFQTSFDDQINTISNTLATIKLICEFMCNNENLRKIFAIILTLGNYMNGGNMSRGQADGFGLEILPKLKDVKSNNSQLTLLDFIVRSYMIEMNITGASFLQNQQTSSIQLPVPEPGDISNAINVDFDELNKELSKLDAKLQEFKTIVDCVLESSSVENMEPFQTKMTVFLTEAKKRSKLELGSLAECNRILLNTMQFYSFTSKSNCDVKPKEFFAIWHHFCLDFKNVWIREQQRMMKERVKELRSLGFERSTNEKRIKKRENGLKAKVEKLRLHQMFS